MKKRKRKDAAKMRKKYMEAYTDLEIILEQIDRAASKGLNYIHFDIVGLDIVAPKLNKLGFYVSPPGGLIGFYTFISWGSKLEDDEWYVPEINGEV